MVLFRFCSQAHLSLHIHVAAKTPKSKQKGSCSKSTKCVTSVEPQCWTWAVMDLACVSGSEQAAPHRISRPPAGLLISKWPVGWADDSSSPWHWVLLRGAQIKWARARHCSDTWESRLFPAVLTFVYGAAVTLLTHALWLSEHFFSTFCQKHLGLEAPPSLLQIQQMSNFNITWKPRPTRAACQPPASPSSTRTWLWGVSEVYFIWFQIHFHTFSSALSRAHLWLSNTTLQGPFLGRLCLKRWFCKRSHTMVNLDRVPAPVKTSDTVWIFALYLIHCGVI